MFTYVAVALAVLGWARAIDVDDCPKELKRTPYLYTFGDKCYRFDFVAKEYADAGRECNKAGGNLTTIKDGEINKFLWGKLYYWHLKGLESDDGAWIGLDDIENEGSFMWSDGTALGEYDNFDSRVGANRGTLTSLIGKALDCVALNPSNGKWEDYKCSSISFFSAKRPFICEYHPVA